MRSLTFLPVDTAQRHVVVAAGEDCAISFWTLGESLTWNDSVDVHLSDFVTSVTAVDAVPISDSLKGEARGCVVSGSYDWHLRVHTLA